MGTHIRHVVLAVVAVISTDGKLATTEIGSLSFSFHFDTSFHSVVLSSKVSLIHQSR